MKTTVHRKFLAPILAAAALCASAGPALATPSTQVWIPSTDVQAYKTGHLNVDGYVQTKGVDDGTRIPPVHVIGPTVGVLPFEKVQGEAGFDLVYNGSDLDRNPFYGHAKLGTPEGSLFGGSPAIAVGGYNFGTKTDATNQNVVYALAARTVPALGRFSAGWFVGNSAVLNDRNGENANNGVLLSWDRTLAEISDRLWVAVDYQGSDSALGALNFGVSWAFAKNASVILGYDIYNEKEVAGMKQSATVQVDINFP